MVSATWTLAGRESVLGILARWMRRRGREVRAFLVLAMRFVLIVGSLGVLVASAWVAWGLAPGLAALGVAGLLLEWVVKRR